MMHKTPAWVMRFSRLADMDAAGVTLMAEAAREVSLGAGTTVFHEFDVCENYLLVLDGTVRVQKVGENGREIVLYRVTAGSTCVLTTSCLLAHENYSAHGVTETDVTAIALPAYAFHRLLAESAVFRNFVFNAFSSRIADLMMLIDEVVFKRVDERLAKFLLEHMDEKCVVVATHQDLAVELGSAREVISRQLKEFERRSWVRIGRGRVTVENKTALNGFGLM